MKKMGEKSRELATTYKWKDINGSLVKNYQEAILKHESKSN
jgi:hypothetical protein